jgi:hypothetical protein
MSKNIPVVLILISILILGLSIAYAGKEIHRGLTDFRSFDRSVLMKGLSETDVVADLEKGSPMDRLVVGDVGFGKTEVAMRAAFVAAMAGKQVAVIAPTTLLARPHFRSFSGSAGKLPKNSQNLGSSLLIRFNGDDMIRADGERNTNAKGK